MRLTRAGIGALVGVPVLAAIAWLFGQPELAMAAAAVLAGLVGAALLVTRQRPRLELRRTVRPERVAVGEPCQVHLDVRNVGTSRTAVLGLRDDVGRFGEAALHLAPLARGASRDAAYTFPTHRRGLHPVGPLSIEVEDPFGLIRRIERIRDVRTVIVLPSSWALEPLPPAAGDEPEHGARVLTAASTVDEEFAAMRPYTVGDDIRRIHWRTTARVGEPVVRQYDQPWQRRTTVLLDVRRRADDELTFERSVSAAASVLRLSASRHELVRLVTTDGHDSDFLSADDHVDGLLDRLAAVRPDPGASLASSIGALSRRPSGRLVTCVGHLESVEHEGWDRGTRGFGLRVLLGTGERAPSDVAGSIVVHWDGGRPLADVWAEAVAVGAHGRVRSAASPRRVALG